MQNKPFLTFRAAVAAAALVLICASAVQAHFPWITLNDFMPGQGAVLQATIGWGHKYPFGGFLEKEAVEELTLLGPDGMIAVQFTSDAQIASDQGLSDKGTYILAARRKAGFYTKTSQGGKPVSKKGLSHVIECSRSHMCMKAIATVGEAGPADRVVGHPIEIVPLKNPADLSTGDYLPVQVLFQGKPYKGQVLATYAGFSTDAETYAYATGSDKKGHARIRLLHPGFWLVKVAAKLPYPEPSECDVESYVATLTFVVD